ncbi:Crp/Fnr family transcriptional regulator [Pseudorhodoferax sp.]|uniref:Crp/Fnr family transcriptional regulator n=1 Tax=Pseudorhodoferax sp. TaxID=1993553 RepID=UPI0039E4AC6A
MRNWFGRWRAQGAGDRAPASAASGLDSALFALAPQGLDDAVMVPWEARAAELGARSIAAAPAVETLKTLWARDRHMGSLEPGEVQRLQRFLQFVAVGAGREIIRQHEYGNFMVVLLRGAMAVDRCQPWGERLRLAESRPGEILGEMSLLDSGVRFSACTTLTDCDVAALSAEAMDEMMRSDPRLAAAIATLLARKLSLRLRAVSARLSDRPH